MRSPVQLSVQPVYNKVGRCLPHVVERSINWPPCHNTAGPTDQSDRPRNVRNKQQVTHL